LAPGVPARAIGKLAFFFSAITSAGQPARFLRQCGVNDLFNTIRKNVELIT
jgi:hypothetical protein